MALASPYGLMRSLESEINGLLAQIDIFSLPPATQKGVQRIRREMSDAKLDVRDYELSETREEQLKMAGIARKRLTSLNNYFVQTCSYDLFSPADVAFVSSKVEHIVAMLN